MNGIDTIHSGVGFDLLYMPDSGLTIIVLSRTVLSNRTDGTSAMFKLIFGNLVELL